MSTPPRVSSGVAGLDRMLEGGFVKNRPAVLFGGPGAGKTTMAIQFLMAARQRGSAGLYITLDEPVAELQEGMEVFGWDPASVFFLDATPGSEFLGNIRKPEAEGLPAQFRMDLFTQQLKHLVAANQVDCMAIDSLTTMELMMFSMETRKNMIHLMAALARLGVTTLLLAEANEGQPIEAHLARGVVRLNHSGDETQLKRFVQVEKMRGTAFDEKPRPYRIHVSGVEVFDDEIVMI